jgi:hypothetical protein
MVLRIVQFRLFVGISYGANPEILHAKNAHSNGTTFHSPTRRPIKHNPADLSRWLLFQMIAPASKMWTTGYPKTTQRGGT